MGSGSQIRLVATTNIQTLNHKNHRKMSENYELYRSTCDEITQIEVQVRDLIEPLLEKYGCKFSSGVSYIALQRYDAPWELLTGRSFSYKKGRLTHTRYAYHWKCFKKLFKKGLTDQYWYDHKEYIGYLWGELYRNASPYTTKWEVPTKKQVLRFMENEFRRDPDTVFWLEGNT